MLRPSCKTKIECESGRYVIYTWRDEGKPNTRAFWSRLPNLSFNSLKSAQKWVVENRGVHFGNF